MKGDESGDIAGVVKGEEFNGDAAGVVKGEEFNGDTAGVVKGEEFNGDTAGTRVTTEGVAARIPVDWVILIALVGSYEDTEVAVLISNVDVAVMSVVLCDIVTTIIADSHDDEDSFNPSTAVVVYVSDEVVM